MQVLPSVTVELFDYWLRNGFFWEYGMVGGYRLNARVTPDGEIEGGEEGHLAVANRETGDMLGWRVLVTQRKYHARYLMQERQGNTFKDFGEIIIEQLQTDRLRVHHYEAKGSGFAAKFSSWLERVYMGSEPISPPADSDRAYWTEVCRQAQVSGNVRQYLADRDIPSATYYDNKKKYGL